MPRRVVRPMLGPDDPERVAQTVRDLMRALAPELKVERRWGQPWYVGNDLVLSVAALPKHASVEFWHGTAIADPAHRLAGAGRNRRAVSLRSVEDATSPEVVALLREAIRVDAATERRPRDRLGSDADLRSGETP
jgi:hypothetical protein